MSAVNDQQQTACKYLISQLRNSIIITSLFLIHDPLFFSFFFKSAKPHFHVAPHLTLATQMHLGAHEFACLDFCTLC